ncbi:MAG: UDP-N-acetylglucosamine 2-epimerase [Planctomycetes bacterium]|nr:UDP-N-acetylglucosamine 2-epimerase [Planctomycetota bacterium]
MGNRGIESYRERIDQIITASDKAKDGNKEKASKLNIQEIINNNLIENQNINIKHYKTKRFALMTLHRPSNVDRLEVFEPILKFVSDELTENMPLIWTIHPRAQKQLKVFDLWDKVLKNQNVLLLNPLGYHDMLRLNMDATIMLTDSGGLQEECTVLGTPCLTLRWNTERPITLREHGGASILVGNNIDRLRNEYYKTLFQGIKPSRPELWDGKTAERCLRVIIEYQENSNGFHD